MLSAEERLEHLEKVFEDLEELSNDTPIVVEGIRDIAALRRLGITKNVIAVHRGDTIFGFAEEMAKKHRNVIILTDWDRRGGTLARMLKEALTANGVAANIRIRARIVILSKKEVKDIESMPTFIDRLRASTPGQPRRIRSG